MSELRTPLIVVEPVAEGASALRAALALLEPVADGASRLLAALAMVEPVANGPVGVRAAVCLVETVIQIPEEGPVATAVFPTLRGLTWDIKKNPEFKTAIRGVSSGRESRTAYQAYPAWNFELAYDWLPDITPGTSGYTDLRTLEGFFLARRGSFEAFLFRDPDDFHVAGGPIATADGVTTEYPFTRDFGGFSEPVGQIDLSQLAAFAPGDVDTAADAIHIADHGLTTGQGPLFVANTGGAPPTGLTADTPYWAIEVDLDHVKLAATLPDALAGTAVDLTAAGSGTNTVTKGWAVHEALTEAGTVPATGPFTITVAHAASFVADRGVTLSGVALTKVAASPAANQYSVTDAGVYTFNAAQAGAAVEIAYSFLATNATLTLPNQLVFAVAPASGVTLTADFDFWFVCRFTDDATEFSQFAAKLWNLQKLDFRAPPP